MGCHALLQGLFQTQGSNPRLLGLLPWQEGLSKADTLLLFLLRSVEVSVTTDSAQWSPRPQVFLILQLCLFHTHQRISPYGHQMAAAAPGISPSEDAFQRRRGGTCSRGFLLGMSLLSRRKAFFRTSLNQPWAKGHRSPMRGPAPSYLCKMFVPIMEQSAVGLC